LCGEYAGAFTAADAVALLPVYDPVGRERKDITDDACRIAADNAVQVPDYDAGFAWMRKFAEDSGDRDAIIIVMGAGPIDGQMRKRMEVGL
jgi:UDP-N-acetylmuramate-alanine ligase